MYIGTPADGLFHVSCPTSQEVTQETQATLHHFADGTRAATIFGALTTPRIWGVENSAEIPADMALMEQFATSNRWYQRGGLQFLPAGAATGNALSPQECDLSTLPGYSPAPVDAGGWILGFLGTRVPTVLAEKVAVPRQGVKTMTFSAWVQGAVDVKITGYMGQEITGSLSLTLTGEETVFSRAHGTGSLPEETRHISIEVTGTLTKPALTFTDTLTPYVPGQAARRVLVAKNSQRTLLATRETQYAAYAYTITELGAGT